MKALKTLNPYFWKHRKMLSLGVLFIILSNFFSIFWIQYMGKGINAIMEKNSEYSIASIVFIIIGITIKIFHV